MVAGNSGKNILDGFTEEFTLKDDKTTSGTTLDTYDLIGLETMAPLLIAITT